jgi:hypothetical protein
LPAFAKEVIEKVVWLVAGQWPVKAELTGSTQKPVSQLLISNRIKMLVIRG